MNLRTRVIRSIFILIPLAIGLSIWKLDAIKGKLRSHRASSLLVTAKEASAKGDWETSQRLSLAAWQLKEGDVRILRQLFESATELQSSLLIDSADALSRHPGATGEDRSKILRFYLEIGDLLRFRELLTSMSEEEVNQPDTLSLAIRYCLSRNDNLRALALTGKLLEQRNSKEDQLLAAEVYLRIPTEENRSQSDALEIINRLFSTDEEPAIALAAFDLVNQIPFSARQDGMIPEPARTLEAIEVAGTPIPVSLFLLEKELSLLRPDADREAILDEAISSLAANDPHAVGEWLIRMRAPEKVADFLSLERARTSGALSDLMVRSFIAQQKWNDALAILSDPHPDLAPYLVYGLEAIIAGATGQSSSSQAKWERALEYATLNNGRGPLVALARFAASAGNESIRNRALTEALRRPSSIGMPVADVSFLFSHLAEADDDQNLLRISRKLLASEPDNPTLINNVIWLELMSGATPSAENLTKLDQLILDHPRMTTLKATRAVSFLEAGHESEALNLLAEAARDRSGLSASDQAVIALTLQKNGDPAAAAALISEMDATGLMKVEYDYFAPVLKLPPVY